MNHCRVFVSITSTVLSLLPPSPHPPAITRYLPLHTAVVTLPLEFLYLDLLVLDWFLPLQNVLLGFCSHLHVGLQLLGELQTLLLTWIRMVASFCSSCWTSPTCCSSFAMSF